jgi:hypothetical protein
VGQGRGSMARDREGGGRWCILWTPAPQTLRLADTLTAAGIRCWTPQRIVKRDAPGKRRRITMGQRRLLIEVALPILPRFVFAGAEHLDDLFRLIDADLTEHPYFRVFQSAGRVPLVGDASISKLRDAEAEAHAEITAERDAEDRKTERLQRANRLGTERARLKALRQERKALEQGQDVTVEQMPALAGMVGQVVHGCGTTAVIHFGGSLTMTVEAWRVHPVRVGTDAALTGDAA